MVAALGLSWATKRMVEDPVRLGRAFASRARGLALGLTAAVPVALVSTHLAPVPAVSQAPLAVEEHPGAAAVAGDAQAVVSSLETALPRPDNAQADLHSYYEQGCEMAITAPGTVACEFGDLDDPALTVALVGDSKRRPVAACPGGDCGRAELAHRDLLAQPLSVVAVADDGGGWRPEPIHVVSRVGPDVLDRLTAQPPDLPVTADRPVVGTPEHPTPDATSFGVIGRGMAAYWERMLDLGTSVIAIRETPEMGIDVPDCLSTRGADPD